MDRMYFTVLDPSGRACPAVEYQADVLCTQAESAGILLKQRFIKLLGPNEPLLDAGEGMFESAIDGRTYSRFPVAL